MANEPSISLREIRELQIRRSQMNRIPLCPDHRDKFWGSPCRECEVERLRGLLQRYAVQDKLTNATNNNLYRMACEALKGTRYEEGFLVDQEFLDLQQRQQRGSV